MSTERIRIFSPRLERAHLFFALVPLCAGVWEILTRPRWTENENLFLGFLANIVLLNSVHVVFTFALICGLPELREWIHKRYEVSVVAWGARRALIVSAFTLVFWIGGAHFLVDDGWRRGFTWILLGAGVLAPHFHSIWQIRGLAAIYDAKLKVRGAHLLRERTLLKFFYASFIPVQLAYICGENASIRILAPSLDSFSRSSLFEDLRFTAVVLNFAIALAILINAARAPEAERSNKVAYLMRLFLYPLAGYSTLAFFGISALHGLEYLFIFGHMTERSAPQARRRTRKLAFVFSLGLLPFLAPVYLASLFGISPELWLQGISAAGIAVVYLHYLVDRALFRMRDPATREAVGPLLL